MPLASSSFLRTDGQTNSPTLEGPIVPLYAVLFYVGKDSEFANTSSGTLNVDYYRQMPSLYYPNAVYYNSDGTYSTLKSNPLISCISNNANWNTRAGYCIAPTTSLPNTGATLFSDQSHNPFTIGRTKVYNGLGISFGETQSTSTTYIDQSGTYTHNHSANNIADILRKVVYGELDAKDTFGGINAITVDPILRDPRITTISTGYNEKRLTFLPKNVLVFGESLPSNNFIRGDVLHGDRSANGYVLPLIAKQDKMGILDISNNITFYLTTNTTPMHNHNIFPVTIKRTSNKTNQKGYRITEAGAHNHEVTYTANVELRSKILKAWVTTQDKTLISNGVIIAYALNRSTTNYEGVYSNSYALPVNWHFCDGDNGTPDLRGYYVYANFDTANSYHDVIYKSANTIRIDTITTAANGNHSHLGPLNGPAFGEGTSLDIGSHTFEDTLDHTHTVSTRDTFKYLASDATSVSNIRVSNTYSYTPPTLQLAFIMYNENII